MPKIVNQGGYPQPDGGGASTITSIDTHTTEHPKVHNGGGGT